MSRQGRECQRRHWREHKPHCDAAQRLTRNPIIRQVLGSFPNLERDSRHFTAAITPRLSEATIRALDLPRHPENHTTKIFTLGVNYVPNMPRDVQRFQPTFCGLLDLPDLCSGRQSDIWRGISSERDQYNSEARTNDGAFGCAMMQIVIMPPNIPLDLDQERDRPPFFTAFETLQITQAQATVPGDNMWACDFVDWLQALHRTGEIPRCMLLPAFLRRNHLHSYHRKGSLFDRSTLDRLLAAQRGAEGRAWSLVLHHTTVISRDD